MAEEKFSEAFRSFAPALDPSLSHLSGTSLSSRMTNDFLFFPSFNLMRQEKQSRIRSADDDSVLFKSSATCIMCCNSHAFEKKMRM